MSKEANKIVKVHEVSATKSSTLSTYIDRTVETLKFSISTIKFPKELSGIILTILILLVLGLLLIFGNLSNTLNQQTSLIKQFYTNTESTVDYQHHIILSDYIKTIGNIVLADNSQTKPEKSAMIRAMTQATLQELDPESRRYVVMFLYDINLLKTSSKKQLPLFFGASLTNAKLQNLDLRYANFQGADLTGADLRGTDLRGANLENATLKHACYNNLTLFNQGFAPIAAGMKEVLNSRECFSASSH
ncbi:pentapeptide repeat-containing protein [Fischerella thermalis]|uniref:pentapeptide repeat-containing protein n=1 Tax=Fischerella thermalis TaxID=372787 RepID=UPI0015E13344|nr:pentapeptide repeat-containing protein [Fischerella thermalis]